MEVVPRTLEEIDEVQVIQQTRMSVERKREVLFQQLDLSGLVRWSAEDQVAACTLLAEYHDILSLEPRELPCTDLAKHEIRVVDDKPFKKWFQRVPPMVDEVWAHVKEMLEVGAINPSQSPGCNTVILVHKKDGGLHFCIDIFKLNAQIKKDSYQLPQIQEAIEGLVRVRSFSYLDLKVSFWQIAMDKTAKPYTAFNMENLGFFKCKCMPFWAVQCSSHISEINAELPRGTELDILLHLFG